MIPLFLLMTRAGHYTAQTRRGSPQLPRSAFAYAPKGAPRSAWRYPVPTRAQAARSHLTEADRYRLHRGSLRAASNPQTKLSYATVAEKSRRNGSPVASLSRSARTPAAARVRRQAKRLSVADTARHRRGGAFATSHQRGSGRPASRRSRK